MILQRFNPKDLRLTDTLMDPVSAIVAAASKDGISGGAIAGIVIGAAAFTAIVVGALMLLITKRRYRHALAGGRGMKSFPKLYILLFCLHQCRLH